MKVMRSFSLVLFVGSHEISMPRSPLLNSILNIFGKKKNIRHRFLITTLKSLGLTFFNSIKKFLTILYLVSFSTSFCLPFFSYMLCNFKWFENFQAYRQFALKNESKE